MKAFLAGIAFAALAAAQDPRGAIVGRISDTSGAVVPGVAVRAVNAETGVAASAVSNNEGAYELLYLIPGIYNLTVEHAGFKQWKQAGVELRMQDRIRIDIPIEVGAVTETVEVTAQ